MTDVLSTASQPARASKLWYTPRVPFGNSHCGAWMRAPQNPRPLEKTTRKTLCVGVIIAANLAMMLGAPATIRAQAPASKRTVIRPGRMLDVRTGELRANQAIVVEGEKITQIAPASEVKAAAGDVRDRKSTRL